MDVFNLYAKLSLNTDDYEKGVEKAKGGASSLMDVFSGTLLGNVVSDGLRTVANGITEIGKTAANIAVSIGKASLDRYADYEQLVGGVETLYKDSAGIIKSYAKDAYKNVGLSANDYMKTSTSFAAALVSSLGGDTRKAAEMANTAISDMSDNANKMGTNISSIQDAYNGFAKQNYTMLDNLKLGYGGTQAEMKRLIKEAAAMKNTQKELGVTVDSTSMSYANIVQAIHVVQANMGIMGTTSKEAATTIQGSTASMKSALKNLLTGIADPEQDFQTLVDNLVDSVITAGNNIIPRIKEIVPTLIDGLSELVTQLAPYVSGVITELEPTIEEGLQSLFGGLSSVASELQPIVADVFSFFGDAIISGLTSAIENSDFSFLLDIFDNVKTAAEEVVPVIEEIAPALVTVGAAVKAWKIGTKIQKMVTAFDEAKVAVSLFSMGLSDAEIAQGAFNGTLKASEVLAGLLTGKISLMTLAQAAAAKAQAAFNAVLAANPITLVVVAIGALVGILAVLYAKNEDFRNSVNGVIENIWAKIQEFVAWVQPYVEAAMQVIGQTVANAVESLKPILENMSSAFGHAWEIIKVIWQAASPFFDGILQYLQAQFEVAATFISSAFSVAWTVISSIWSVATSFFSALWVTIDAIFAVVEGVLSGDFSAAWEAIKNALSGWNDFFISLLQMIVDIFKDVGSFFLDVGKSMIKGISDGWTAAWNGFVDMVMGMVNAIIDRIKSAFNRISVNIGGAGRSHAGGLDYVPYNNYSANLHRGEMVLTADEADKYRRGQRANNGFTVNQTIYAAKQTPVELAASTAAYFQQARWAL